MKTSWLWALVVLIILGIGAWWYNNSQKGESAMGEYAYTCANGSGFSMTPSEDVSSVMISAGSQGMFTGTGTLQKAEGVGARFEGTVASSPVTFVGAGEEVQLTVGGESTVCNPVPSTEMAPWNWGDAGEGGGEQPDVALVVSESIVGKWQSTDDAKFVREFQSGSKYSDWYDGKVTSSGMWVAFVKGPNAPKQFAFPMQENKVYLQMTETGTQEITLNFSLEQLTPDELVLIFLDRGGALKFKSVQ